MKTSFLLIFALFIYHSGYGQKRVGLVLSGGGAAALAHVGVLKALEEYNIPIDYITGSSAGALVGSLYSCGYSPLEIEQFVLSDDFILMSKGGLRPENQFLLRQNEYDASILGFSLAKDSIVRKSIPLNIVTPTLLDFEMLKILGHTSATIQHNFDNLFIPFRCVASDVYGKNSVTFSKGNLNEAVRASMTYPLYVNPIKIDGVLYFDGGMYDNFPSNVMCDDFSPDFVIGSNVSSNMELPDERDMFAVLRTMLTTPTNYKLSCSDGIVIEAKTDIGTFEFERSKEAIDEGYFKTLDKIDSIVKLVGRNVDPKLLVLRRNKFRESLPELKISSVETKNEKQKEVLFAGRSLMRKKKNEVLSKDLFEKRYYRLSATPSIWYMYPNLSMKVDSTYHLKLKVNKAKEFTVDVGGHFSSRPVNTGYLGLGYQNMGKSAFKISAESYFGKFYGSVNTSFDLNLPTTTPFSISGYYTMNRWDFFRSFATFFEDVKPSFLVQFEMYGGLSVKSTLRNNSYSQLDYRIFGLEDDYYQIEDFTNIDTADFTRFEGSSVSYTFQHNTLNRKQFSSSGNAFDFSVRYVSGRETSYPGSTSIVNDTISKKHNWLMFSSKFQIFPIDDKHFRLGIHGKGVWSTQTLFANYTASLLASPCFDLIPDSKTFFLPEFRSPQFLGSGLNFIFSFNSRVDFRFDAYMYQPILMLSKVENVSYQYAEPINDAEFLTSASVLFHSLVGPIRATINYFPKQKDPLYFQVSYGYVIFNDRAIR